jgi:hypothetical protein
MSPQAGAVRDARAESRSELAELVSVRIRVRARVRVS